MENLKALQDELIYQKQVIEDKSGYVVVANTNPSPYEITEGIKTIPSSDLSIATATEEDVLKGKTFFAGNSVLKTGTAQLDPNKVNSLFMYNFSTDLGGDKIYYSCPSGLTALKRYTFYKNSNAVELTFNPEITSIEEYACYEAKNFSFVDFHKMTNLVQVLAYAFCRASVKGIDFSCLPNKIVTFGNSCFQEAVIESLDYKFPDSLTSLGQATFRQNVRTVANNLDLSNLKISNLSAYCFYNYAFNCDFCPPQEVKAVNGYFNYNGSFKNILLQPTFNNFANYCFGANSTRPLSEFYLQNVVITSETLPYFGTDVFAPQHMINNFKIFVPDNVIEEYKAINNLSKYVDYIHPISEMV